MELINGFMSLPEVQRYSKEYGAEDGFIFKPESNNVWFTYKLNGEVVGVINMHVETGSMCMFHPYILRVHKDLYKAMIRCFMDWFSISAPNKAIKLNAIIPEHCENTIKIAISLGFLLEGIDRMSYRTKHGVCDRMHYGITRKEMGCGKVS
tara:strand:- start:925 stop:1377 length:453 start_codon:yes stop_codon:yes gene_type:complete